jgi:hypothetical protein
MIQDDLCLRFTSVILFKIVQDLQAPFLSKLLLGMDSASMVIMPEGGGGGTEPLPAALLMAFKM